MSKPREVDYVRLVPGEYFGYCSGAVLDWSRRYKQWKVLLRFDIFKVAGDPTSEVLGTVPRWLTRGSDSERPSTGKNDYYRWWVQANGGALPPRRDRQSEKIFRGRLATVLVGDSEPRPKRKDRDGNIVPGPPDVPTSKVVAVLAWHTGNADQRRLLGTSGASDLFTQEVK